jgi:RNA polymerase sigma-70 factor (ECF subfamily)
MNSRSPSCIPTRRSLLSRIKNLENQESWREFYNTYWRLVHGVARQAGLTEAEAQDVVQETFCKVAKNIANFHYNPKIGSFKSWLLNTTRWHVADQFRARQKACEPLHRASRSSRQTTVVERIPDPQGCTVEQIYEDAWRCNLQDAALEKIRLQVKPKQYQAFYLHAIKRVPVVEIARLLGITPNQVYLAKLRITRLAAQEVRRLERELV